MRAGVVVNVAAGRFETLTQKLSRLEELFEEIFTGPGKFGGDFLRKATVVGVSAQSFKETIRELTLKLCKTCDVIVTVGGDGTANMVAEAILDEGIDIPILGIAGGTANVGPLIRFSFESLTSDLRVDTINFLEVRKSGNKVGYAFIDAVFGDTFLGTINGEVVNLSAAEFLKNGRKISKIPRTDITECLKIIRNGERLEHHVCDVAQVVVSPLNFSRFYIGKAVTGALCWAPFVEAIGVLSILDTVIVRSGMAVEEMKKPVVIQHMLFSEDEELVLEGFKKGVYVVLDGNPICECDSPVVMRGIRDAVKVFVPSCGNPYPMVEV